MPSESKPLLTAQTEKPNHYKYLKEFRVEQCPSFLQHKCTQHRPFTCFHWHFNNQRRRRPVRKRDGTFNYSADNYCTKYNETSGICEDGDECPYLHRTAGDTERRYHLRYYKTCMCVHDTDARGLCTKNGSHCAFAHGAPDLRPPVLDARELQTLENPDGTDGESGAPNALDRERNLMCEDPKWQDTNYVLSSYKTEPCKRPPRLCRQGYACPQYHNSKDKRRSPRKHKYRSTPCPHVKHGEEWGEPGACDAGDACAYCHTRTEQQFHPEIYKSTKCNDVQQAGYCPRGLFCAFAHVEPDDLSGVRDMTVPLDCGTNLADLLTSALPQDKKPDTVLLPLPTLATLPTHAPHANGSGELSECTSVSSAGSRPTHAPLWSPRTSAFDATVLQEVVGNALDDMRLDDPINLVAALDRDLSDGETLLSSSAPQNRTLRGFSPPADASPLPFLRLASGGALFDGEMARLRDGTRAWEQRARTASTTWQVQADEARTLAVGVERQRDDPFDRATALRCELDAVRCELDTVRRELDAARLQPHARRENLRNLPLSVLKSMQAQARTSLDEIESALYTYSPMKCFMCDERARTAPMPCGHYSLCEACAVGVAACPYCHAPASAQ